MERLAEEVRHFLFVFCLGVDVGISVIRTRYQPEFLGLPGGGEVSSAVFRRDDEIIGFMDDEHGAGADLGDDVHGPHSGDVDAGSEIRDQDCYGCEGKGRKVDEVFEAGGDYAGRVAEAGIVYYSLDLRIFGGGENGDRASH